VLTEELLKAKAEGSKGTPAFDEADQNGDGQISRQEWASFSGGAVRPGDRGERRPHERRRVQRVARSGHAGPAAALKATLGLDTAPRCCPSGFNLSLSISPRRPYGRSRAGRIQTFKLVNREAGDKQVRLQATQLRNHAHIRPL
jgi:EF hand